VTLNHGDTIVTEAPTFMAAGRLGASATAFPDDSRRRQGIRMDALARGLAETDQQPRFVYLLRHFRTRARLDDARPHREVLEIAQRQIC